MAENDPGFTRDMKLGESLTFAFEQASGGGYLWDFDTEGDLKVVYESVPEGKEIEAPTTARFLVKPLNAGTHEIVFRHKRPWEDTALETRTYTLNVQP